MSEWLISALRPLLSTETAADSEVTEELMSQIRENWEALLLLFAHGGASGSLTSDPPDDTTGVATDSGASYATDEHNGRTLLITSGLAKNNLYTIDDTTSTTIVCTGDNLYADGVRDGDDYIVLYDIKTATHGHDHDGVNSKLLASIHVGLPCRGDGDDVLSVAYGGYAVVAKYNVWFPSGVEEIHMRVNAYGSDTNSGDVRFNLDSATYTTNASNNSTFNTTSTGNTEDCYITDLSSYSKDEWHVVRIWLNKQTTGTGHISTISFRFA
jgi:hypothetical protein